MFLRKRELHARSGPARPSCLNLIGERIMEQLLVLIAIISVLTAPSAC